MTWIYCCSYCNLTSRFLSELSTSTRASLTMQWCPVDICTRGAWGTFLVASKADLPRLRKDVSHDIPAVTTLMLDMDSIISVLNHRSPIFGEDTWPQYPRMVGLKGVFMCRGNASRTACHFGVLELWAQMDSVQMTLFGHIFRAHGVPSRWRSSHDCKPPWRVKPPRYALGDSPK